MMHWPAKGPTWFEGCYLPVVVVVVVVRGRGKEHHLLATLAERGYYFCYR